MKTILIMIFLACAGCNGFKQSSSPSFDGGGQGGLVADSDYQLVIENGPYQGKLVVDQIRNSSIKILLPIGMNNFVPVGNFSSNSISGRVVQDANNFKTLEANVPVSAIAQGVNAHVVTTLPNGDALDFLTSGEAQHFSFPLDNAGSINVHVYFSPPSLVGVFIQTPFDMGSSNKYSVAPMGGFVSMGFFSTHPHNASLNGGSFVFISLPR